MNDVANLGLMDDDEIVLDEAALTLALLDHEGTDLDSYEDLLAEMASRLDEVGTGAVTAAERAAFLAQVLADEFGFTGDAQTYDDPDNADLIRVIDRRQGLPISLSILYVAAARHIGWAADILNLPGHVLVTLGHETAPVIVDPFRNGMRVGVEGVTALLASAGEDVSSPVRSLAAMSNRTILVRLLLNQATRAEKAGRNRRALTLYCRMTSIAPGHPHAWWERARLELANGDLVVARASLAAMLEITRDPQLREQITNTLDALATS